MEHYKARLVHASPHDTMVHWPSELAFSENFYPHPAEDGYAASAYPPSFLSELRIG